MNGYEQLRSKPFLTAHDLMEALEVTNSSFWRARQKGQIPAPDFTIGKSPRWSTPKMLSFLGVE